MAPPRCFANRVNVRGLISPQGDGIVLGGRRRVVLLFWLRDNAFRAPRVHLLSSNLFEVDRKTGVIPRQDLFFAGGCPVVGMVRSRCGPLGHCTDCTHMVTGGGVLVNGGGVKGEGRFQRVRSK